MSTEDLRCPFCNSITIIDCEAGDNPASRCTFAACEVEMKFPKMNLEQAMHSLRYLRESIDNEANTPI